MADIKRTLSTLKTLLADNISGQISAQDIRDFLVSTYGVLRSKNISLVDTPYFMTIDDNAMYVDASGGDVVVNLPTTDANDKLVFVTKTDASENIVTVQPTGGDTLFGGLSNIVISLLDGSIFLHKKGTVWTLLSDQRTVLLSDRVGNVSGTGVLKGGVISINGSDAGKFDISDGYGIVVNNYTDALNPTLKLVGWTGQTAITPIAEDTLVYLSFDETGDLVQQTSEITLSELRDKIYVGSLLKSFGTVRVVTNEQFVAYDTNKQLNDFLLSFGMFNVNGNVYDGYGDGYGTLELVKSAGETFKTGLNYPTNNKVPNIGASDLQSQLTFTKTYRSAVEDVWTQVSGQTEIDPDNYDNGTGTLQAVTSGFWTIQRIFFFPTSEGTYVQYGNVEYSTKEFAESLLGNPFPINPIVAAGAVYRGALLVKQGATGLKNTNEAVFYVAGKFGASSIITGSASGEINTASNIGTLGVGPFFQKSGVDLQFNNIAPNSSKITVTSDVVNHNIKLDVQEGNVVHQNLNGAGTYTHTEIDTHINNLGIDNATLLENLDADGYGIVNLVDPTNPQDVATKQYVDDGYGSLLDDLNTHINDTDNAHPASAISTDTGNFDVMLSSADTDVQKALETIDGYGSHPALLNRDTVDSHPASAVSTDTSNFNVMLSSADTDVQKALETIDGYGSHPALLNRDTTDSHPATAVSTDTSNFNVMLSAADIDVQKALETIDGYGSHPALLNRDTTDSHPATAISVDTSGFDGNGILDTADTDVQQALDTLEDKIITPARSLFHAYDATGATAITVSPTWTDLPYDTEVIEGSDFTHAADSAEITINTTRWYTITYYAAFTGDRDSAVRTRMMLDTGGGYVELGGTAANTSRGEASNSGSASVTIIRQLSSGNKIKVQATDVVGKNVATQANATGITIVGHVNI